MKKSNKLLYLYSTLTCCIANVSVSVYAAENLTTTELKQLLIGNFVKLEYVYKGENIKMWEFYQPDGTVTGSTDKWGSYSTRYELNEKGQLCLSYGEGSEAYNGCYYYEPLTGNDFKLTGLTWPENTTVNATVVYGLYKNIENN